MSEASETSEMVSLLKSHIRRNDDDHAKIWDMMQATDTAIRGNGAPGLRRELDAVSARVRATEAVTDEIKQLARRFVYGTLALIAMGIVTLLVKT